MGKLLTYGIIVLVVLAILFFGLKYPSKFIEMTGSFIGWGKEKAADALDKTDVDEKITEKIGEKTSELSDKVVADLKEKGIETPGADAVEVTIPNEEGVNETFVCVRA